MCTRTMRMQVLNVIAGRGAAGDMGDLKPQGAPIGVISSVGKPEEVISRESR